METLEQRLKDSSLENTVTTVSDYGMLLAKLSNKVDKPLGEIREGKGGLTYGEWNKLLNN